MLSIFEELKTPYIAEISAIATKPTIKTHEDDHCRFEQDRELLQLELQLLPVILGRVLELDVERSGVLTDAHHLTPRHAGTAACR